MPLRKRDTLYCRMLFHPAPKCRSVREKNGDLNKREKEKCDPENLRRHVSKREKIERLGILKTNHWEMKVMLVGCFSQTRDCYMQNKQTENYSGLNHSELYFLLLF